jgi:hypothetical protein
MMGGRASNHGRRREEQGLPAQALKFLFLVSRFRS